MVEYPGSESTNANQSYTLTSRRPDNGHTDVCFFRFTATAGFFRPCLPLFWGAWYFNTEKASQPSLTWRGFRCLSCQLFSLLALRLILELPWSSSKLQIISESGLGLSVFLHTSCVENWITEWLMNKWSPNPLLMAQLLNPHWNFIYPFKRSQYIFGVFVPICENYNCAVWFDICVVRHWK